VKQFTLALRFSGGFAAGVAEGTAAYFNIGSKAAHSASFFSGGSTTVAAFKAVAHGVSRALIAKAQGNNARSAFISGFMSSGFAAPKSWGMFGGTMATAAVAGTVSQATGGKFANGAVTGAYVHLFNGEYNTLSKGLKGLWNKKAVIANDAINGVSRGMKAVNQLMTTQEHNLTPRQQAPLEYLKFKHNTAPSNSRQTLIDSLKGNN
jgi:hypothetical protein